MYEKYFNFSRKPFQLNPDPEFFFGSRGHRRAQAYLEYGLHQGEGFIVITGEVGAGKTTLVRSLLEKLDPNRVVAANLVSTYIDANDMLRMVASAFGLPTRNRDKADLLVQIETFLVSLTAAGKRALLIVDEAQNLTPAAVEELRMLSNFQLEDHALLQSFLVGQPEFRDIMQSEQMLQLRQRVIASYHLGPLDSAETRAYVEHRLGLVGWKSDPSIESAAHKAIFIASGGVPRRINTLCDRVLLSTFLAEKREVSEAIVNEVAEEMRTEMINPVAGKSPARAGGMSQLGLPALNGARLDPERFPLSPELTRQIEKLASGTDIQRVEARLTQLEQSLSATLGVLRQLVSTASRDVVKGEH